MKITTDELFEITAQAGNRLLREIKAAYDGGHLKEYLEKINMDDLLPKEISTVWDGAYPNGNILIVGDSAIKTKEIMASLKSVNFPKERVDLHLGYEELKRYKFGQLQFNPKIRLILVGPMPHSVSGKDEFSSIISMMERTEGFTKIKRLMNGSELKISKTNLKISVQEEIDSGYLVV